MKENLHKTNNNILNEDINDKNRSAVILPDSTEQRVVNVILFAKCQLLINSLVKENSTLFN